MQMGVIRMEVVHTPRFLEGFKKIFFKLVVVEMYIYNSRIWEAEAGGW
jgi:hypothetical protein